MDNSLEERSAETNITRRKFLKTASVSALALVSGSWLSGCGSKATPAGQVGTSSTGNGITLDLNLPENKALADTGGTLALGPNTLDSSGIFVYRTSKTSVEAMSRTCTHLGCQVAAFANGVAKCPCHGSQYDMNGQVINGPANKPLTRFQASLDGTTITITPAS
jgi:cytochrome b6-f complex iron-sulfur subunit